MNSTLLLLKGKISDVNLIELKGRLDRMASVGHYSLDLSPVLSTLKSPGIRREGFPTGRISISVWRSKPCLPFYARRLPSIRIITKRYWKQKDATIRASFRVPFPSLKR